MHRTQAAAAHRLAGSHSVLGSDFGIDDAYVEASLVSERSSLRGRLRRRGLGG